MSCAIFDLDGTLVDSVAICATILNDMLEDRGQLRTIAADDARAYVSIGGPRMVAALLGDACITPDTDIIEFRARYAALPTPPDSLFAGVRAALEHLRARGVTLALCSNKPQDLCDKVLADLGLAHLFAVVVGGGPGLTPKPAPDLLDRTLTLLGIDAQACCFVGDSEADHLAARAMPFILVEHGYADPAWDFCGAVRCTDFLSVPEAVIAALADRRTIAA